MCGGSVHAALTALREGRCVAILDGRAREAEVDLFFPAAATHPQQLRFLRTQAGGELFIAIGHEVAATFGLPFAGAALGGGAAAQWPVLARMAKADGEMCQGGCSVGVSLDHRSTKTGAPDDERSVTVRRLAALYDEAAAAQLDPAVAGERLGAEFHLPGHIFLCQENPKGLAARRGHTELSVALAKAAGITPVLVGCVMLSNSGDDFGALGPDAAAAWAAGAGVPLVEGADVVAHVLGPAAAAAAAPGAANGTGCAA
ncbi:ribB [Scenedesmus sp. PABB004]|nr:ribB [Scenedesmus sp. PABB004]